KEGEPLVTIYSNRENVDDVIAKIYANISIADSAVEPTLIHSIVTE
ncbi:MAG: pyrimidine-nucleoside phosphorylase, partial [Brochothrix sp.]|nr:pyrimidine-nucleoside phosphorylase [Brochothrix sp.]